ncbi:MAG: PQQ-dependent sugar dehydrogenase [Actinomycetota bacterium]|nr:PQQ-dependent sugar dehydrogenase [Actinomycetota bacterium]
MRFTALSALLVGLVTLVGNGSASVREPAAASAFQLKRFARGFEAPVLLTHAPGEPTTLYVVEQPGRVVRVRAGKRTVFMDVRSDVEFGGEQGLLGLAFHPEYARNRLLYIAYTSRNGRNTVARYRSNGRAAIRSSQKTLLSVPDPYSNHNGGQLAFGKDGMLYTTIGDGGSGGDPEDRAQDMGSPFGKLLRLDVSKPGADWAIAGLGLRNAWRFSFDRVTGDLYLGDVGQNAIEEVSFTPRKSAGLENYGWDLYEGSRRFEGGEARAGKLVFPLFEYGRREGNCTVIGGHVYRGSARPAERGRYIFGDYCSGIVWTLNVRSGAARNVRRESFRIQGLTSFGESSSGELYATTQNGVIYRLT